MITGTLAVLVAAAQAEEHASGPWASQLVWNAGLVLVAGLAATCLGQGALRQSLAGPASLRWITIGALAALPAFALSLGYVTWLNTWTDPADAPVTHASLPARILTLALSPALVEEWLCRGVLWIACARATSVRGCIFVTAALFALLHGLEGWLFAIPHRFALGLVLGWLRARSGALLPSMTAHFVHNLLALLFEHD